MLPNYVLCALLCAYPVSASSTWGSLGYVGGNMLPASSFNQAPLFWNAMFGNGKFTDTSRGPIAVDANGYPAVGGWQTTPSALFGGVTNTVNQPTLNSGQLTLASYSNCLITTPSATPCVLSVSGGSISAVTLQADDGTTKTYTFTLAPTPGNNFTISGTQPISFIYVPRDGSTPYNAGTNPFFNPTALAHYGQMNCVRMMDFCNTLDTNGGLSGAGKMGEKTWSDPVTGRVPDTPYVTTPHSWETIFKTVNAFSAAGNRPESWIHLPGFATAGYATSLATLANTMSVPPMKVAVANEAWNPAYPFLNMYRYFAIQEAQAVGDYGAGTLVFGISGTNPAAKVVSATSDSSGNVTVTLNVPVSNYPAIQVGNVIGFSWTLGTVSTGTWNSTGAVTAVTTNTFTYLCNNLTTMSTTSAGSGLTNGTYTNNFAGVPLSGGTGAGATVNIVVSGGVVTTANLNNIGYGYTVGDTLTIPAALIGGTGTGPTFTVTATKHPTVSATLLTIFGLSCSFTDTNKISSVTSDGSGNVTVTLNVPLSSLGWTVAAGTKIVAGAQTGTTAWNIGTAASPATITSVTTNSFTYPCPGAPASSTLPTTDQFSVFMGQVASSGVGLDSDLFKALGTINIFTLSYLWYTRQVKTLRDAWNTVRTQDKWVLELQTYGSVNPGNVFSPPVHFAFGTYLGNLAGSTTPNLTWLYGAAVAPYNVLPVVESTTDAAFAAFTANVTGAGALGIQIESHVYWSRKNGLVPLSYEYGPDIQKTPALQIEISSDPRMVSMVQTLSARMFQAGFHQSAAFQVTPEQFVEGNAQGAWGFMQTFGDTFTNQKMTGLLSMLTAPETYSNINGTVPCAFLPSNSKLSTPSPLTTINSSNPAAPTGIYYWTSSGTRDMSWLGSANASGSATFTATATDSAAGTQMSVYIDNVLQGAVTVPQGGAGSSISSTPAASTTLTVTIPKGPFILKIAFLSGGTSPGITQVALA